MFISRTTREERVTIETVLDGAFQKIDQAEQLIYDLSRRFPVFHDLPQAGKRRVQSLFCLHGHFFQKLCNSFLISRLELRFVKISFQGRKPDTCFLCRLRLCGLRQKRCKRPRLFLCQCKSPLP